MEDNKYSVSVDINKVKIEAGTVNYEEATVENDFYIKNDYEEEPEDLIPSEDAVIKKEENIYVDDFNDYELDSIADQKIQTNIEDKRERRSLSSLPHRKGKGNEGEPNRKRRKQKTYNIEQISAALDQHQSGSVDENLQDSMSENLYRDALEHESRSSESLESDDETDELATDRRKRRWAWKRQDLNFKECEPSRLLPRLGIDNPSPLTTFKLLFTDELIDILVAESNKYIILKSMSETKVVSFKEMQKFIGMLMWMSINKLPERRMYWAPTTRFAEIADVMGINRFEAILSVLHASDNSLEKKRGEEGYDPYFKIRPFIKILNENFQKSAINETHQSIDEHVMPFKGHHSKKVYLKKKSRKLGYTIWVRAGVSGYIYEFEMAGDVSDFQTQVQATRGESGRIVLRLCATLPKGTSVFYDTYFASLELLEQLKKNGLFGTCTLRSTRSAQCPLSSEKDLKKIGRGSMDYRKDRDSEIIICKWYDTRQVLVASNAYSVEPQIVVMRYNKSTKKYFETPCPNLVYNYNKCIGGANRLDMLLSLYRIFFKSKKWYRRLIFHFIDMCVVNAWTLYRASKGDDMNSSRDSLLKFKMELASALIKTEPQKNIPVHPHGRAFLALSDDIRYDRFDHFPQHINGKEFAQRCKLPGCKSRTRFRCMKCNMNLCILGESNCFYRFHHR